MAAAGDRGGVEGGGLSQPSNGMDDGQFYPAVAFLLVLVACVVWFAWKVGVDTR